MWEISIANCDALIPCLNLTKAPEIIYDGRWVSCTTNSGRTMLISASVPLVIKAPDENS